MPLNLNSNLLRFHFAHPNVDGAEFCFSCQQLNLQKKGSSAPSTSMWQLCISMTSKLV